MSVDVKTFISTLPARPKLEAWEAQIFELLAANATYAQVVEFLKQNGVEARRGEISNFVHRQKRRSRLEAARNGAAGVRSSEPQSSSEPEPTQSPAATSAKISDSASLATPSTVNDGKGQQAMSATDEMQSTTTSVPKSAGAASSSTGPIPAAPSPSGDGNGQQAAAPTAGTQQTASTQGSTSSPGVLPKFDWQSHRNKKLNW